MHPYGRLRYPWLATRIPHNFETSIVPAYWQLLNLTSLFVLHHIFFIAASSAAIIEL